MTTAATASGVVLLLSLKTAVADSNPLPPTTGGAVASGPLPSGASPSATSGSGSASAAKTVTGDAANTRYGPIQVKITVKDGKITDISVPEYPKENPVDQMLNSRALPQLRQEAIVAQSAHIDVVSGATYTSDGYTQSLQSAIDKAGL
ncbi:FMN-binding protein [Streptomyces sp. NPDC058683]|uniref:FMN-binding protein n=1 Tax=Streptomyces sp. NPDC058683 TaxID=3346597 RepID=UPI00364C6554